MGMPYNPGLCSRLDQQVMGSCTFLLALNLNEVWAIMLMQACRRASCTKQFLHWGQAVTSHVLDILFPSSFSSCLRPGKSLYAVFSFTSTADTDTCSVWVAFRFMCVYLVV